MRQGDSAVRPDLFTIGYQGTTLDALIDRLSASGVASVIDVRAVPVSRKPGFSKRMLGASLEAAGIRYEHLPALGTPKPGREAARRNDRDGLERIYGAHLGTEAAIGGLGTAFGLARASACCLLCFEAEPACCHRRLVADALVRRAPFAVRHLSVAPARLRGHERT